MSAGAYMTASNQAVRPHPTSSQRNKHRLYLLFSFSSPSQPLRAALIVTPKNPDPARVQTWRFQVRPGGAGGVEATQVINYDQRMVAAVLLCKLDPAVTGVGLSMLLSREVPVRGTQWACDAINLLVEKKIIPALPIGAHSIWEKGQRFAESVRDAPREDGMVPACDVEGTEIRPEIART